MLSAWWSIEDAGDEEHGDEVEPDAAAGWLAETEALLDLLLAELPPDMR